MTAPADTDRTLEALKQRLQDLAARHKETIASLLREIRERRLRQLRDELNSKLK